MPLASIVCSLHQLCRHPDRRGGIPQANGAAVEVFDADPSADQGIEPVFHRLERRERGHLIGLGQGERDGADALAEGLVDGGELPEQAPDPLTL